MSEFEKWFRTTEAYKMLEEQNYFKMDLFFFVPGRNQYRHSGVQIAFMTWDARQSEIDQLKKQLNDSEYLKVQHRERRCELAKEVEKLKAEKEKLEIELSETKRVYRNVVDMELAKVEKLKAEKAGLEKLIKEWRKSANWMCATDDKHVINSLRSCADDLEKVLRGEHE